MAENSAIEWTDHTFNPWIGCSKISLACDNCYAERLMDHRLGRVEWGGDRVRTSAANWRQPVRWNAELAAAGGRARVFCASLADVFDNQVPPEWRADLFALIRATPHLDWLLLTKRIGNAAQMAEAAGGWPANVWLGATVVDQAEADRDVPKLLAIDGPRFRFLSMEPLLGPVDLTRVAYPAIKYETGIHYIDALRAGYWSAKRLGIFGRPAQPHEEQGAFTNHSDLHRLDWIIVGGESGPGARPLHPDSVRGLRDQCAAAGVPFLFKQWGEWAPGWIERCYEVEGHKSPWAISSWPAPWWPDGTRGFGDHRSNGGLAVSWHRSGKRAAGRLLDGRQHDGVPA